MYLYLHVTKVIFNFRKKLLDSSAHNNKVAERLVKFIAGAKLPISTVSQPEFVELIRVVNPTVALPCSKTFGESILPKAVIILTIYSAINKRNNKFVTFIFY